jgi:hypothetical protein
VEEPTSIVGIEFHSTGSATGHADAWLRLQVDDPQACADAAGEPFTLGGRLVTLWRAAPDTRAVLRIESSAGDDRLRRLFGEQPILVVDEGTTLVVGVPGGCELPNGVRHLPSSKDASQRFGFVEAAARMGLLEVSRTVSLVVWPRKITAEQAALMYDQLCPHHERLLAACFDQASPAIPSKPGETIPKSDIQRLLHYRHLVGRERRQLHRVLDMIAADPHRVLERHRHLARRDQVTEPAVDQIDLALATGDPSFVPGRDLDFQAFPEEPTRIRHDTYPNRFARHLAERAGSELRSVGGRLHADGWDDLAAEALQLERVFRRAARAPVFRDEVGRLDHLDASNQVVLKEPRYRELGRAYRDLRRQVALSAKIEQVMTQPVRDLWQVYEFWCFFQLAEAIAAVIGGSARFSVLLGAVTEDLGLTVTFESSSVPGVALDFNLPCPAGVKLDELRSYSVGLRPDFVLRRPNGVIIVLDAKYRVDLNDAWTQHVDGEDGERRGKWILGDVYKMHTYREALRVGDQRPLWAIALYPGTASQMWTDSDGGGVGALPLRPGCRDHSQALQMVLRTWLTGTSPLDPGDSPKG